MDDTYIHPISGTTWAGQFPESVQREAVKSLESGRVLFFPKLAFEIALSERMFLNPAIVEGAKNVSFNPATGKLGGCVCVDGEAVLLTGLMKRFSDSTKTLLENLLPAYRTKLATGRTSLRPIEIAGRVSSWRKDDTRLHVDCFPSTPVQGRRILRVFSNVNPDRKPRSWRIGEPFEDAAKRFAPTLSAPVPGANMTLQLLRITKSRRSAYDHFMLQIHDLMKADDKYQRAARQLSFDFPAGSTWVAFTDQVLHAATAGQHQLEQTFYLPVSNMTEPQRSPLRVLEGLMGKKLAN